MVLLHEDQEVSDFPAPAEGEGVAAKLCSYHSQMYRADRYPDKCARTTCLHEGTQTRDGVRFCRRHEPPPSPRRGASPAPRGRGKSPASSARGDLASEEEVPQQYDLDALKGKGKGNGKGDYSKGGKDDGPR